ncbi:MAG: isomerase [Betaproteobacteria bacterium HGW-Betaproteobacteria-21]|nr:MAG: isomerase [Betaproteobacteria bacterium HGW-Betaproteobacteria-21]
MEQFDASAAAENLARFYQTLTPLSLTRIDAFYAEQAQFKDPFNDVSGLPAIARIFEHMFATVETPRFVVTTRIVEGRQAMLGWDFHLQLRGRALVIRGVSHVRFDDEGKVLVHRDYWDAAEELYAKLPILGALMRALRRKLSASEG